MTSVIAFANQKGGVGKTTSAVNTAAALGALGRSVLLIDLDPQGNTTSGVGVKKKALTVTTYDVLLGAKPFDAIKETQFKNMSIMPANISLAGAEFELIDLQDRERCLKNAIDTLREDGRFEYILIDCPPSLGILTITGLTAADSVIIPMTAEYYALEGLTQLMNTVRRVKQMYNKDLYVLGILITMYNGRLNLSTQVMSELKKYYSDKLFKSTIGRNVKLSEAPSFGKPIYYHEKYSRGSLEYMELAREIIDRIGE